MRKPIHPPSNWGRHTRPVVCVLVLSAGIVGLPACQNTPAIPSRPPSWTLAFASNTQEGEVTVKEGTEVEVRFNHPYEAPPQVVVVELRGARALETFYSKEDFQIVRPDNYSFRVKNKHSERGDSWATIKWRAEGTLARGNNPNGDLLAQKGKTDQELLIERIKAAGGKVSIDPNPPKPPDLVSPQTAAAASRDADKNAVNVTLTSTTDPRLSKNAMLGIDVHGIRITDADLVQFEGITSLHVLNLFGTKVTDAGMRSVATLTELRTLYLSNTALTDAGLQNLQGLVKLEELGLNRTAVTDGGLAYLKGFSNLHVLSLVGTKVTDKGIEQLKGLHTLKRIYVSDTRITAAGIKELKAAFPKMEVVK